MNDPQATTEYAWWGGTVGAFRGMALEAVVERLALRLVEAHPLNHATQIAAWRGEIGILQGALAAVPTEWVVLFEYPLLRLGRRLDVVIVTDRAILVLEFKMGAVRFDAAAMGQLEDYALDLQDFHAGSRDKIIVPILVASEAVAVAPDWPLLWHGVSKVFCASGMSLDGLIDGLMVRLPAAQIIDVAAWEGAAYRPVPTIIEAATMLYARHGVAEIAAARADVSNLRRTTEVILQAVADARATERHVIVFVTGIPGAGKTLCGLNAVFGADTKAAFLTGNLPLVHVLREALARDAAVSGSLRQARQKTESAIQGLTGFVRDNVARVEPPHEHVVVFDEAQRAWDAAYGARKFGLADSEAALFLDIMRKHADFAVVIALVGNGQEINTGEAGLGAWGQALAKRPDWVVRAAAGVLTAVEPRQRLFEVVPENILIDEALHLAVPVRSVRSAYGGPWVDAVLRGDAAEAAAIAEIEGVPFFMTRSLPAMRAALRARARGERRAGLVCSTGARRLVADGIWPDFPHLDQDAVANWFLNHWPDVRASDALEIPATQFACQGLELDYVGLCWGGDFVWEGGWVVRRFVGTKWQRPAGRDAIDFRRNSYRVLLTRARYDTVIWVPEGDAADATREPELFEQTVGFLLKCGATMLEEQLEPSTMLEDGRLF